MNKLKEYIKTIPRKPGIYLMKDNKNNIIYVGKAISLKSRVSSYFNNSTKSTRIEKMVSLIDSIEYIVTKNEVEALILECSYIKNINPKFNVLLKDDKTYPYLKLTINDKYPTMYITRKKTKDKSLYFGPYTNVKSIKETFKTIKEIFPVKRCKYNLEKTKVKPCLYYHIGRCLAPCKNDVNAIEYKDMINQIVMFLKGNTKEIENILKKKIEEHIENLEFEKAEEINNRLISINNIKVKQNIDNLNEESTDIVGYVYSNNNIYIQIFKIRGARIAYHEKFHIEEVEESEVKDLLISCISGYYLNVKDIPKKMYIKLNEEGKELVDKALDNIKIISPKIGDKLKLIKMAEDNIKINLEEKEDPLKEIKEKIGYDFYSIESYDISNLRNDYIVGGMIRIDDGKLNKKMYRKFKIKSTLIQNDPLCMYEVLSRRFKRVEWEFPNVIFIDGGINQINACLKVFKELNVDIPVYGMIKDEKHRTKGLIDKDRNEISLSKKSINFLTFIQDEVHRFTLKYHRTLRDKIK